MQTVSLGEFAWSIKSYFLGKVSAAETFTKYAKC